MENFHYLQPDRTFTLKSTTSRRLWLLNWKSFILPAKFFQYFTVVCCWFGCLFYFIFKSSLQFHTKLMIKQLFSPFFHSTRDTMSTAHTPDFETLIFKRVEYASNRNYVIIISVSFSTTAPNSMTLLHVAHNHHHSLLLISLTIHQKHIFHHQNVPRNIFWTTLVDAYNNSFQHNEGASTTVSFSSSLVRSFFRENNNENRWIFRPQKKKKAITHRRELKTQLDQEI